MGPFIKASENPYQLKTKLLALSEILTNCDNLKKETDLVFVPALDDPTAVNILPRPSLPATLCGLCSLNDS